MTNPSLVEPSRLPGRAVLKVTGPDADSFLQGLITNGPPATGACFAALLTPQGKILFDFIVVRQLDGFLLDVAREAAQTLQKRLTLYRLRAKVEIAIDDTLGVAVGSGIQGEISYVDPRDQITARVIAANATLSDLPGVSHPNPTMIRHGIPEWGTDFGSDEVFLMDVNFDLLNGVDYKKGCFVGQEVASRMKRKGAVRKRTLIAEFDGSPPPRDAAIMAGASTLGHMMSGVDGVGLAPIRLDRWQGADAPIECDGKSITLRHPDYSTKD